jgi:acyl carrier protein
VSPNSSADVETTIRSFLAEHHPQGRRGIDRIGPTDNLWREVNSLNLLLLVEYIEAKFAIAVAPIDFAPQHFSTIAAIAKFVVARSAAP